MQQRCQTDAAQLLAQRAKKKQDVNSKVSMSSQFDPSLNLIDFNNMDRELDAFNDVNADYLMSAAQLRVRPASGKSALQILKPISRGNQAPEIPKGANMKNYILERQKNLKSETIKAEQGLQKAQNYKPKQKSLNENPYYLGNKPFEEKPYPIDQSKRSQSKPAQDTKEKIIQRKQSNKRVIIKDEIKSSTVFKTEPPTLKESSHPQKSQKIAVEGLNVKSGRQLDSHFDELQALRDQLMDSSIDSAEFDQEIRDKVKKEPIIQSESDEEFTNTDMKYYKIMEPMEKFKTIQNRAKLLGLRAKEFKAKLTELKMMDAPVAPTSHHDAYNSEDDKKLLSKAVQKFEKFQRWRTGQNVSDSSETESTTSETIATQSSVLSSLTGVKITK